MLPPRQRASAQSQSLAVPERYGKEEAETVQSEELRVKSSGTDQAEVQGSRGAEERQRFAGSIGRGERSNVKRKTITENVKVGRYQLASSL
jgi:hypothetical protein